MKDRKFKIVDNFLPKEEFKILTEIFFSHNIPWYFTSKVAHLNDSKNGFYFYHVIYDNNTIFSSHFNKICFLWKKIKMRALLRVKANLYTSTNKLIVHTPHRDYDFHHSGFILSLNNCNGFTKIGKEKIPSIANRALFFDSYEYHSSTTCTDVETRKNININYIE